MRDTCIGYAMCGSFCTFSKAISEMKKLARNGYDILPIMSHTAYSTDTRFGRAKEIVEEIEDITGKKIISTICEAEPIGPKKMCDLLVISPCTGNTLSKLTLGITDTSVTMAAKSHLRILRPLLINLATNDALGACGQNIGRMLNIKNVYFVPMRQDAPKIKPNSLVADFDKLQECVELALKGEQYRPVFV